LGESMDFADFWFCKKVDKNWISYTLKRRIYINESLE
jgi:hypothetical protein